MQTKRQTQVVLAIATLCLLGSKAIAQAPGQSEPERLFNAAKPYLEETLGRPLGSAPRFLMITPPDWRQLFDSEREAQLRYQFSELRGDELNRARTTLAEACRRAETVRRREDADLVLVSSENPTLAAWVEKQAPQGIRPEQWRRDFLQLSLVYEAARWSLEQQHRLPQRWQACRDGDEFQALQALAAGRALWITRRVARRLGTEACMPLLTERYLHVPDADTEPGLRLVVQQVLRRRHWACEKGLAFFDYLERQKVTDAESRVFARPPRLSAWIERPDVYLDAEQNQRPDLAAILARVERALSPADWTPAQQPWTPDMIRQSATLLGVRERGERVARDWQDGRSLMWSGKDRPGCQVGVGLIRFQDAAGARAYVGLAADLQRKQDELLNAPCAEGRRVIESHSSAVQLRGADEAALCDKRVQFGAGGEPVAISQLWARAGNQVVEFTWNGVPANTAWAQQMLDAILDSQR
jgi:hypothetical protein